MNKEEIKELINDPIIKVKVAESTNILMDLYELGFNNGFKLSQSQLDIVNKKLDKYNNQEKKKYKLFIRQYDITKNDYIVREKIVNTHDIYHEIGYIYCNEISEIKRIDYQELEQKHNLGGEE